MNEHERQRLWVKAEHAVDSTTEALSTFGFPVSSAVVDGPVEAALESVGRQMSAALTIVGSRGLNIAQRVMLGSVGSALARRTSATLVVREPSTVIAVDEQRTRETAFV
jgi:nucleotide-binding universal stress UspA family protein